MNIEGLLIILVCLVGYWYAWKSFAQGKHVLAISIVILLGLALRLLVGSDLYLHSWDERYHALVAKNMMDNPFVPMLYKNAILPFDPIDWSTNHIWLHKQPVPLWSMSISMHLFGVNEFAVRLPSLLLSTFGIFLMYEVGRMLFNRRVGFIAAFLFSIHGLILEVGGGRVATDHIDVFFLVFILMAVYFTLLFEKRNQVIFNILVGVAIGLAILTKWLPALIVLPLWFIIIYNSGKLKFGKIVLHGIVLCLVIFVVAFPWQYYIQTYFPVENAIEKAYNMKHLTHTLNGQTGPFYYHFDIMRMIYGDFIYIPFIWLIYLLFTKFKNVRVQLLAFWILVPFLFFSFAQTKMQGYTLFAAPALFLMIAYYWHYLKNQLNKVRYKWMAWVVLVALIALPVRYSIERIKPFGLLEPTPEWVAEIKKLKPKEGEKMLLFNAKRPIEIMFYTDIMAYRQIPSIDELDSLEREGYSIYFDEGNYPDLQGLDSSRYTFISLPRSK